MHKNCGFLCNFCVRTENNRYKWRKPTNQPLTHIKNKDKTRVQKPYDTPLDDEIQYQNIKEKRSIGAKYGTQKEEKSLMTRVELNRQPQPQPKEMDAIFPGVIAFQLGS